MTLHIEFGRSIEAIMARAFATKVASNDLHTIKEDIGEPTFTANITINLLLEPASATLIAIMAALVGVEPSFVAKLVETNFQNHSSPKGFQSRLEVN